MKQLQAYLSVPSLASVYIVCFLGILLPSTRQTMLSLTSFSLLLAFATLIVQHQNGWERKLIILFSAMGLVAFSMEVLGLKTGFIFGWFTYGTVLGHTVLGVPPLVGLNWLLLVYCTYVLASQFPVPTFWKIVIGALFMTLYDWVLEHAVLKTLFWTWSSGNIPVQNYVAWFGLSLLFHALLRQFKVDIQNKAAISVFIIQIVFWASVAIFLRA
jgi:bisanhydrobacterioruberin hydratase